MEDGGNYKDTHREELQTRRLIQLEAMPPEAIETLQRFS